MLRLWTRRTYAHKYTHAAATMWCGWRLIRESTAPSLVRGKIKLGFFERTAEELVKEIINRKETVSVEFCVVLPLGSALPTIWSVYCYQGCSDYPFCPFSLLFFGRGDRGRGSRRLRGLSFSLSFLLPVWPMVHWRAKAQCVAVGRRGGEGGSTPPPPPPRPLSAFGLAASQSGSRGRGAPLAFSPPAFIFPSSVWVEWSWRHWSLTSSGIQRPAGAWASGSSLQQYILWIYMVHSFRTFISNLQLPPWIHFSLWISCMLLQLCWVQFRVLVLIAYIWAWLANQQPSSMWGRCLSGRTLQEARWVWCYAAGNRRISPWNW